MKVLTITSVLFLMVSLASCSDTAPKQPAGRCAATADCPQGYECKETFCEDIYFPRKEIKNY